MWILRNARIPFLLRPVAETGRYRLVGEVYVHGIMRGEAMDKGDLEFRGIELE